MDRKLLQPGTTLLYVLKNLEVRPLIMTRLTDPNGTNVNGIIHFDGPKDASRVEFPIGEEQLRTGTAWIEDIPFNEPVAGRPLVVGTYHLPSAMAAAART